MEKRTGYTCKRLNSKGKKAKYLELEDLGLFQQKVTEKPHECLDSC